MLTFFRLWGPSHTGRSERFDVLAFVRDACREGGAGDQGGDDATEEQHGGGVCFRYVGLCRGSKESVERWDL